MRDIKKFIRENGELNFNENRYTDAEFSSTSDETSRDSKKMPVKKVIQKTKYGPTLETNTHRRKSCQLVF